MRIDFSDAAAKGNLVIDALPICGVSAVKPVGLALNIHPNQTQPARVRMTLKNPNTNLILSSIVANPVHVAKPVRFTMKAYDLAGVERGASSVTVDGGCSASMFFFVSGIDNQISLEFATEMAASNDSADYAWARFERVSFGVFDEVLIKSGLNDIPQTPAIEGCVQSAHWIDFLGLQSGYKIIAEPARYSLVPFICNNREELIPIALARLDIYNSDHSIEASRIYLYAYQDIILLPHGVILVNEKAITETIQPLPPKYKDHVVAVWRSLNWQAKAEVVKSEPDQPVLLLEQPGVLNYGHWLVEMFPKLFPVLEHVKAGKIKIGLTETQKTAKAIQETLLHVGVTPSDIYWLPDQPTKLKKVLYLSPISRHQHPGYISPWGVDVLNGFTSGIAAGSQKKIFVSRKDASTRQLLNEDEVYSTLEPLGYVRVRAGDMSFVEQVETFKGATHIVGVFGASMTNIVFCQPGTKLLIISPNNFLDHFYWNLASLRQLSYWHLNGTVHYNDKGKKNDPVFDFEVDIKKFVELFEKFASA